MMVPLPLQQLLEEQEQAVLVDRVRGQAPLGHRAQVEQVVPVAVRVAQAVQGALRVNPDQKAVQMVRAAADRMALADPALLENLDRQGADRPDRVLLAAVVPLEVPANLAARPTRVRVAVAVAAAADQRAARVERASRARAVHHQDRRRLSRAQGTVGNKRMIVNPAVAASPLVRLGALRPSTVARLPVMNHLHHHLLLLLPRRRRLLPRHHHHHLHPVLDPVLAPARLVLSPTARSSWLRLRRYPLWTITFRNRAIVVNRAKNQAMMIHRAIAIVMLWSVTEGRSAN